MAIHHGGASFYTLAYFYKITQKNCPCGNPFSRFIQSSQLLSFVQKKIKQDIAFAEENDF